MSKKRKKKNNAAKRQALKTKPPVATVIPQTKAETVESIPPLKASGIKQYKTAILAASMAVALCVGAWLIISPMLEKQKMQEHQSELLESISSGDGVIVLDERFADADVDFYDGGADAPAEETVLLVTVPDAEAEPAAITEVTGVGILYIDSIDAVLPVTDGVSTVQLKVAVGHVPQTAQIGSEGNAVIAGHRSYTNGQFFNRLGEVAEDDLIRYEDKNGADFTYKVYETLDIVPGDPVAFDQPEDEYILTLYTCTPIRTATHRLLVRARLINEITEEETY